MEQAVDVLRKRVVYVERGVERMKSELGDRLSEAASLKVEIDDSNNLLVSLHEAIAKLSDAA